MTIKATYTPPPKQPGQVTLEMDEDLAQKLRALLGCCTGCFFDQLHNALGTALPQQGQLKLVLGQEPNRHSSVLLHPSSGARFY
jgi:hypothetical protein